MSYHLPHEYHPSEGIVCSGCPSPDAFPQLAADGVTVAINLRLPEEDPGRSLKDEVEAAQIRYIHIPISGAKDFTQENVHILNDAIHETAAEGKKLYVFCGSSNRVGGLFALKAFFVDGKSEEESIDYGRSAGLASLEPLIRGIIGKGLE